jgi:hypothetical protein
MAANWLERNLLPLRQMVPDFEVRRLRAFARAAQIADGVLGRLEPGIAPRETGNELWVSTEDGLVGGYIDCAAETPQGIVLRDYKTGVIHDGDGSGALRPSYQLQLRLYAALYHARFGRWPVRLEIIPLRGEAIAVPFSSVDCTMALADAVTLLQRVNARVEQVQDASLEDGLMDLASPHPAHCRYCAYRPVCPAYRNRRSVPVEERWPSDVLGKFQDSLALGNGRLSLSVREHGRQDVSRIRGINPDPDRHPALFFLDAGVELVVCGLRSGSSPDAFTETASTTIYASGISEMRITSEPRS